MKATIIGGGNMGGAIARGLAAGSVINATDITVTARTEETLSRIKADVPELNVTTDNLSASLNADIIFLAVKPWLVQKVLEEIFPAIHTRKPLLVSVAAGISFDELTAMLGGEQLGIVRVIPNTAIAISQSPTLICFNDMVAEAQRILVKAMFDELGQGIVIEERLMAAGTAVTSCGIAYAMQYVKAAIQGAIELGFYPHVAKAMIDQTVAGAVALMEHNGTYPDAEIYKVCTPGGITIKGLNEMTAQGFDAAVIAGLKKAAGK
ncbi:MAG: pyrroline-5-carboxylate reductase [Bacteroidales bacterium]|nr:pyrroline-5-carboxylate reductase [Candidatus Liminaster caballi]